MNKLKGKQIVKILMLSVPVIALVIATLFGLDEVVQGQVAEVLTSIITIVAGALGIGGIVANNDKDSDQ